MVRHLHTEVRTRLPLEEAEQEALQRVALHAHAFLGRRLSPVAGGGRILCAQATLGLLLSVPDRSPTQTLMLSLIAPSVSRNSIQFSRAACEQAAQPRTASRTSLPYTVSFTY
jgi:hypothetical protein